MASQQNIVEQDIDKLVAMLEPSSDFLPDESKRVCDVNMSVVWARLWCEHVYSVGIGFL